MLRSQFNYDTDQASLETGLKCDDKTLTQQHQAEEADINTIVKRFNLTGQMPSDVRMPTYGDFTAIGSYQDALNQIIAANESFLALPAQVRQRFSNDPDQFVTWCSDPENLPEAVKLGLAVPRPAPVKEEAAPAATTPPATPDKGVTNQATPAT